MNLVLVEPGDLSGDEATLRGRRARHVVEVHRAAVGDVLRVGLLGGDVGEGTVVATSPDEVRLRLSLGDAPPAPGGVDVVLALPRPKVLRRLLANLASVGVRRIALVNAARVEKSYFDSPLVAPGAMREALMLGLEQARDTVLPELVVRPRLKPFVEDELGSLWPGSTKLLAHPAATKRLESCPISGGPARVVVAVGPEGGFVPFELELFARAGFDAFSFGPRVLRSDVAVVTAVAQIELLRRLGG